MNLIWISILFVFFSSIWFQGGFAQEQEIDLDVVITPEKVKYGEPVFFEMALSSYEKSEEETFHYILSYPDGFQKTLGVWFAKGDSEDRFDTWNPSHNVVKAGNYTLKFEKAVGMKKTGSVISSSLFEITTNPPPLVQQKRGVVFDLIQCNNNLVLVQKYSGSPACVKPKTIEKLIDRNWTTSLIVREIALKTMSKNIGPECSQHTIYEIQH